MIHRDERDEEGGTATNSLKTTELITSQPFRRAGRFTGMKGMKRMGLLRKGSFGGISATVMTMKEQALSAIRELPENTDLLSIIRELSFLAGIEAASREIADGEGMDSTTAKQKLREWIGA
jgi:hypothetical protein